MWSLNNKKKTPMIHWKIMKIIYSKATSDFCKLCLMEKLNILNAFEMNKRKEFRIKCYYQNNGLIVVYFILLEIILEMYT